MTTRISELQVDPANLDQARAWGGDEGRRWVRYADSYEIALRAYDEEFLQAARVQPTDRVLDVGCGTGHTSRQVARLAASGAVLGVDVSARMLAAARQRARQAGLDRLAFEQADAQVHPFPPAGFDLVISRMGVMFFADVAAALANLARSLRPSGRLVLLTWQPLSENAWITAFSSALAAGRDVPAPRGDQPGPFALSDSERLRRLVRDAGFESPAVRGLRHPMYIGRTVDEAAAKLLEQFGGMLDGLDEETRQRAVAALQTSLEQHQTAEGVAYPSAAWLTTAVRVA